MSSEIDVGLLLGPLEVEVSGALVRFDGVKQRRLFVVLALRAPRAVSVDELLEALWGDELPTGAVTALQKQISRLRQRLGDGPTVRHQATGYALNIDPRPSTPTDSRRCWRARAWHAVATIRSGPQLTCGRRSPCGVGRRWPIIASTSSPRSRSHASRRRLEALEERLAAELAGGADADLVGELQALVAEHPLRERLRAQLMVALCRPAGRRRRSRRCAPAARCWWRSWASSRDRSCAAWSA